MNHRVALPALLAVLGAGWGATTALTKIAVSTGHGPFGLIFWQLVLGVLILGALQILRRRPPPLRREAIVLYIAIALLGTLLPNAASYLAARHLPGGVLAIAISLVPMMAFPMALALGLDRFSPARLAGLCLGLLGVLLIAVPGTSVPGPNTAFWLMLVLVAPFFYAAEGTYVSLRGTAGCDAVEVLLGASMIGAVLALPLALGFGQWINPFDGIGAPEGALALSSAIHACAYVGYVWLIGRAGSVFAAQVAYIVTGTGVLWSMAILGERYSGWVWLALVAMMAGLFLVQPRPRDSVAPAAPAVNDAA